jgi:hypothetical protein
MVSHACQGASTAQAGDPTRIKGREDAHSSTVMSRLLRPPSAERADPTPPPWGHALGILPPHPQRHLRAVVSSPNGDSGVLLTSDALPSHRHLSRGPRKNLTLPARKVTTGSPPSGHAFPRPLLARTAAPDAVVVAGGRWLSTDPGCPRPDPTPPVLDLLRAATDAAW